MGDFHKASIDYISNMITAIICDGVKIMAKKGGGKRDARVVAGTVLTQRDADKFKKSAEKYTKAATTSKKKAQNKLVSLGIYTKSGRLSKKYG